MGATVLAVARRAIEFGLVHDEPPVPTPHDWPGDMQALRAAFVTLTRDGRLRGCVGCLRPTVAFGAQVQLSAFRAAFRDPRMTPVRADELDSLCIEVAALSALERVDADDEAGLLERLTPGVHGVLAESGEVRATFLPKVWRDLPAPERFFAALRAKAGLDGPGWPAGTAFYRYRTEVWSESVSSGR